MVEIVEIDRVIRLNNSTISTISTNFTISTISYPPLQSTLLMNHTVSTMSNISIISIISTMGLCVPTLKLFPPFPPLCWGPTLQWYPPFPSWGWGAECRLSSGFYHFHLDGWKPVEMVEMCAPLPSPPFVKCLVYTTSYCFFVIGGWQGEICYCNCHS